MDSEWPEPVKEFEAFLLDQKLTQEKRIDWDQAAFGNKFLQYAGGEIKVRIVRDRGDWDVGVQDITRPSHWYYVSRLKELLGEHADESRSLEVSLDFVQRNWAKILDAFGSEHRAETHDQLDRLGRELIKARFGR